MQVTPKTEAEVSNFSLFPKGIYDFEILTAVDKKEDGSPLTSKAGNAMTELKVRIFDKEGKATNVFDYLVNTDGGAYKIRHCASACGLLAQYESGELDANNLVGCTGQLSLGIQKSDNYPDRNTIFDYIAPRSDAEQKMVNATHKVGKKKELDDEIPF